MIGPILVGLAALIVVQVAAQPCVDITPISFTFPFNDGFDPYGVGYYQLDSFIKSATITQPQYPPKYFSELAYLRVHVEYKTNFTLCATNNGQTTSDLSESFYGSFSVYLPGDDPDFNQPVFSYPYTPATSPVTLQTDPIAGGSSGCIDPIRNPSQFALLPSGSVDFDMPASAWSRFFGSSSIFMYIANDYNPSYSNSGGNFERVDHFWLYLNITFIPSFLQMNITKKTNAVHYSSTPGASVLVPSTVTWTYQVTNYGTAAISSVVVTDSKNVIVTCPQTTLGACQSQVCTGTGAALSGQYTNVASCSSRWNGTTTVPCGNTDPSFYFGFVPAISILKFTNGVNTNVAAQPQLPQNAPVTWTYAVTNTGNCDLTNVAVTDSKVNTVTCPSAALAATSAFTCTAVGQATTGQYNNVGSVTGFCNVGLGATVTSTSPSSYLGYTQAISVVKFTNGVNTNINSAPFVLNGSPVTWTYTVTNTGTSTLTNVGVQDNLAGPASCLATSLAASASTTCSIIGVATVGTYINVGTATGISPAGAASGTVTATSPSTYFGVVQAISVVKTTNDVDTRFTTGPTLLVGSQVTWKYTVTNNGNSDLVSVAVADNRNVAVSCPSATLHATSSMVCSGVGTAVSGTYTNVGTASGRSPVNQLVTATSPSNYLGGQPVISLVKYTNNVDIRTTNNVGPLVLLNAPVTWAYTVTNIGNVALSSVAVADNHVASVSCPSVVLAVSSSLTCFATGTATSNLYTNVGTATGQSLGASVSAISNSSYFGVVQQISIQKYTNDVNTASASPPNIIVGGSVTWKYAVTNLGNTPLTSVTVSDSKIGAVTCPGVSTLAVGSTFTCSATGLATANGYSNVGTATGVSAAASIVGVGVAGATVTATSPSAYFGVDPHISLLKLTNNFDIRQTGTPSIVTGAPVTWSFVVTNTGNSALSALSVTDNLAGAASCPVTSLALSASTTCSIAGVAISGSYSNTGSAHATSIVATPVFATSTSAYTGVPPSISITKLTNDVDIRQTASVGPVATINAPITWKYIVVNNGIGSLSSVTVTDNMLSPTAVTCPQTILGPASVMTCSATGMATAGSYSNVGTATGLSNGSPLVSTSPSNYFGVNAGISLLKLTNTVDTVANTRPNVAFGSTVTWTYRVTNIGNSVLSSVSLTDNRLGAITCPSAFNTIAVSGSAFCTATGLAQAGDYNNTGVVTATSSGVSVTSSYPSAYFGVIQSISINKLTNDVDIRSSSSPQLVITNPVTWKYAVTNTGNAILTSVTVIDNHAAIGTVCVTPTLAPTSSFVCSAVGTAVAGPYTNIGTALGTTVLNAQVSSTSPSSYFAGVPVISINKFTNGVDIRVAAEQPYLVLGGFVTWTYAVTNTGNTVLTNIQVNDNHATGVVCPASLLAVGSVFTCTATGLVTSGSYTNVGTATGLSSGVSTTATSPSSYFGVLQQISVVKVTNDVLVASDHSNQPNIQSGNPVTWKYTVTNLGNTELSSVTVTDNLAGAAVCPNTVLLVGSSFVCSATGVATVGPYTNVGTARGVSHASPYVSTGLAVVTATSPSAYFGFTEGISIVKYTNNINTNLFTRPTILLGGAVTWSYVVSNLGNAVLSSVVVHDNLQGIIAGCPTTIAAFSTFTCAATGIAVSGVYTNVATAVGVPPTGGSVTSTSPSSYLGGVPVISIVKFTNDVNTNVSPRPDVLSGGIVTWKYAVTNTGNVVLSSVTVQDNLAGTASCPVTTLGVGSVTTCTINGVATVGVYTNVGSASATSFGGSTSATSPSSYFGISQQITVVKFTNNVDIRSANTPQVLFGTTVVWKYQVTNNGNTDLTSVVVSDNRLSGTVNCPSPTINPTSTMTCFATGTATSGPYTNVATASGVSRAAALQAVGVAGATVTSTSNSAYFGVVQTISIVKYTNDVDIRLMGEPNVLFGAPITWKYAVTNTGNVLLSNVHVSDNQQGPATCPATVLSAGSSFTCSITSAATSNGDYNNVGTAFGDALSTVTATSPSKYFGVVEQITLVKYTNNIDTPNAGTPNVLAGSTVTWSYVVTNTGNKDLVISVQDNQFGSVPCPVSTLAAMGSTTCTATGAAITGSYDNIGTAFGVTVLGDTVTSTYPSSYFGAFISLSLDKLTNGVQAPAQEDGPTVALGSTVTWTYTITNTGNYPVSSLSIFDNQENYINCDYPASLDQDASVTCTLTGVVGTDPYENIATATGRALNTIATSTDISHYNPAVPGIQIIKKTNAVRASAPTDPYPRLRVGTTVTWTYEVSNTGGTVLSNVEVTDNMLQSGSIVCPDPQPFTLPISSQVTCSATGVVIECRYRNRGCVTTDLGEGLNECDDSNYLGVVPAISLVKFTDDYAYGPIHDPSSPVCINMEHSKVTWTYIVSNIGEDLLSNVAVSDDQLHVPPYCPRSVLGAWDTMTCTAVDAVVLGPYTNIATAFGTPQTGGDDVTAVDQNWYKGVIADVGLKIQVNGMRTSNMWTDAEREHFDGDSCEDRSGSGEGGHDGEGHAGKDNGEGQAEPAVASSSRTRATPVSTESSRRTNARSDSHGEGSDDSRGEGKSENDGEGEGRKLKGYHRQRRWRGPELPLEGDIQFTFVVENFGTEDLTNVVIAFPDASESGRLPFVWFTTAEVTCPSPVLPAGSVMTCSAPGGSVKNVGQQELEAVVKANAQCDGQLLVNQDEAYWWNKQREDNGRREGDSQGSKRSGKSKASKDSTESEHEESVKGCDIDFWRHPRHFDQYPSIANGQPADITPQTSFRIAAGLTTLDPNDNSQLNDKVLSLLWSWHDDPLTIFLQKAVVALLNSATNPDFVPRYSTVLSDIRESLAAYQRGDLSAIKYLCQEWGRTESANCPFVSS